MSDGQSIANEESGTESEHENDTLLEHEILPSYHLHLLEHANQTRSRLLGSNSTLVSSFFAPNAYWTGAEKEALFHALAVFSRFRPDLIAEAVGTKTIPEVCVYLDMLDDALRGRAASQGGKPYQPLPRRDLPAAYEVSEEWIAFEENQATLFARGDSDANSASIQRRRDEEIREYKGKNRARRGEAKREDNQRDREGEKLRKKRFESWLKEKREEWKVADLLESLDDVSLKVMDAMLREEGESGIQEGGGKLKEFANLGARISIHGVEGQTPAPTNIEDEVIDPVLLRADDQLVRHGTFRQDTCSEFIAPGRAGTPTLNPGVTSNQPFPLTRRPLASTSHLLIEDTQEYNSTEASLSPASRRRLQKRMYMRRKRAECTGVIVDESITRLKPGRKRISTTVTQENHPRSASADLEPMDDSQRLQRNAGGPKRQSGKRLPYKIREKLEDEGINSERLREEGLDMFHLSGFSRLMRTYNDFYEIPPEINSEISANTIRLLGAHVMHFTAQVVRRAIVSREQEMVAKMNTKAWGLTENQVITSANVVHALSLLGVEKADKRAHFEGLLERLGLQKGPPQNQEDQLDSDDQNSCTDGVVEEATEGGEDDEDEVQDQEEEIVHGDSNDTTAPPPLFRQIFPPGFRLPPSYLQSTQHDPVLGYLPWGYTEPCDISNEEDSLFFDPEQDDSDDEALLDELEQEEELDALDCAADRVHERDMWNKVAGRKNEVEGAGSALKRKRCVGNDDDQDGRKSARRAYPSWGKAAPKSMEFIVDSD